MEKKKKKKGFTLIELLAVIIILGILMIIAIPSVTKYISDSRKNAYIDTAKEIVSGTRNVVNEGKLEMYDTNTTYYIPYSCISTENAKKTPYGEFVKAYTAVLYDGHGYEYYFFSVDDAGQGIRNLKKVDDLEVEDIESDLKVEDINTRQVIGNKTAIKVYNDTCSSLNENITIERPTFRVLYGFDIFSSPNYTLIDINKNGNNLTTTSNNAIIRLNDLGRYTNIEKIIISLNEGISGAVPIKVKSNGNVVGQTTTSNGTKKIEIDITKSTYDSLDIVIEKSGVVLDVDKIEVLTEDSGIWSNSNVTLYIDSDNDLSNTQVSYDNGKTWQDDFSNEISETESGNVLIKTEEQVLSIPINVVINVDKVTPIVNLLARDTSGREITTGTWTKYGINFTLTQTTTNTSGTHIYYCKDNNGTCTPNIEVNSGTLITEFNNLVGTYFVRYTIKSNAGLQDGTGDFYAKVDKTRPTCSFDTLPDVYVNKESVINLNCTDLESGINIQDLTTNDFTLSNNNMTITSITKEAITNGVKYKITVRGVNDGDTNISLKENVFEDNVTNKNTGVSTNVHINGVFIVTLNNQSATTAGTTEIYEFYTVGWYSDINTTSSISSITVPAKNGYMFGGYFTSTNGGGNQVIDATGVILSGKQSTFNNDGTLYAYWIECGNGSYCINNVKTSCPAGTYGNGTTNASSQAAACQACGNGAWCTGGTARSTCPGGTYGNGALNATTQAEACQNCGKNYYCTGGTARAACETGRYTETDHESSSSACLDACASGNTYDSPTCGGWGGCSGSCPDTYGTKYRTCTHRYYSNKISGYLCSTSNYTESTGCSRDCTVWHYQEDYYSTCGCGSCPQNMWCQKKCQSSHNTSTWACTSSPSTSPSYASQTDGEWCWCKY